MNQSEQAQAIAEIRERTKNNSQVYSVILMLRSIPKETLETHNEFVTLLEIVDSQAQKIAEQTKTMEVNAAYAIELQGKIAEQAKEIERMTDCMFHHMTSDTYNHCQEHLEKMRGNNEKAN